MTAWLLAAASWFLPPADAAWADAMHAEAAHCPTQASRLRWALGCLFASLRRALRPAALIYPAALSCGLTLLASFEWRQDERPATLLVLCLIALLLGALRPAHALLSGATMGAVVAAVIAFEAATGIRPAYETHPQSLAGSLYWMILLVPAVAAAWLGARARHLLPP